MSNITPLLRFLRCTTKPQREAFARSVGTTLAYLYQLAGATSPNPQLKLAHAIVLESRKIGKKIMADPRLTARVYDATVEERRKSL